MKLGKPAQKGQMALPPRGDLVVVVAAGDRCRHNQQQNLRQRIAHLRRLARIGNHRKTLKQLRCRSFGTASSMAGHPQRLWLSTNHTSLAKGIPFSTSSR
jgi:hypothetical protein